MLDSKLFEFAAVYCANDYIMARETRASDACLTYINTNTLRIENLIFKPQTSQLRFMFLPCAANAGTTEVFNVNSPPIQFLRQFWDLGITALQSAMTQYMIQSDIKAGYKNLAEAEQTWVASVILGSKQ